MKLFRRISVLVLAVVMICLLSASAFAATDNPDYEKYETFGYDFVGAVADIYKESTSATLTAVIMDIPSSNCYISLSCTYRDYLGLLQSDSHYVSGLDSCFQLEMDYHYTKVEEMVSAAYIIHADFESQITYGAREVFEATPTLTYPGSVR